MLARAAGLTAKETAADAFTDAASLPAWAKGSIGAAAEAGLMSGYADGTFRAEGLITRAQAVVTLDRLVKRTEDTVIETAGATLENKTVTGDLILAESVGEGNITLKNVTVLGDLIIRGGGADSVYLNGVQVKGTVRMQKENVHLRLMGDTALGRVEIGLPGRVTGDSTFTGRIGTLAVALEKNSGRSVQIEVPVSRMELLSKANVALGADVETLQISKDAEGAQLDIRRGAAVGELSIDAGVALTGSGLVISLIVSADGVTVSGSLSVRKTETADGAKAPTVSGGSSGGSSGGGGSSAVWTITGAAAVPDVTVDYGTSEAEAMSKLPGAVTLNAVKGSRTGTVSAQVSWALDKPYDAKPSADTVYTAIGTVTVPGGYTYGGPLTVTAKLTVKADPGKTVISISEVWDLELPYGAVKSDARLPAKVTVETETGATLLADVTWTPDGEWASPGVNKFTGTVTMPAGYYYHGKTTAAITATVTVVEDGVTPGKKLVVGHVPLPLTTIGYADSEELVLDAAKANLPTNLLLKCQDDSYIAVTVPAEDWYFTYTPYYPNSATDQEVSLSMDAALPMGYADNGSTIHVYCSVEVKKLDTEALKTALNDAKALLDTLTDQEEEALKDPSKIYAAPNGTAAEDVKFGVKFISKNLKTALKTPYDKASVKISSDTFASQAECDELTRQLQDAITAFEKITPGEGTNYTDDILAAAVKKMLDGQTDAAYAQSTQPLKPGRAYPLASTWTDTVSSIPVRISWEAYDSNGGDVSQYIRLDANGVTVIKPPEEPLTVVFTAQAARTDTSTSIDKIASYTATVGAPIRFSDQQPSAPLFASGYDATGEIYLNLEGVDAITDVDTGKIEIVPDNSEAAKANNNYHQINAPKVTSGAKSANGVCLDVSFWSPNLGEAQRFPLVPSTGSDENLKHSIGVVVVTIKPEALTLDESTGWYFPEAGLTQKVNIWLVNPQMDVTPNYADPDHRNISVRTKYIGEVPVQVAFTKTANALDINYRGDNGSKDDNVRIWVEIPYEQSEAGSDGERIYSAYNVAGFGEDGDYYVWCRAWEGTSGAWLYTNNQFTVDGEDTD